MKYTAIVAVGLSLAAGCQPKDREALIDTTGNAYTQVRGALHDALAKVGVETAQASPETSKKELARIRKDLEQTAAEAQVKAGPALDALKEDIRKIDAARKVQDLQKEFDNALHGADNPAGSKGRAGSQSDNQDTITALQDKLEAAKWEYKEESDKVRKVISDLNQSSD